MFFLLTILLASACFAGDNLLKVTNHDFLKAVIDNSTHVTVAVLSWLIILLKCHRRPSMIVNSVFELLFSAVLASAIDVDHFLLAKSFKLKNALNLGKRRPPFHCTTLPVMLLATCIVASLFYDSPKIWRFGWLTWVSFSTHHIRDGLRRGIWLWPFGSTPPVPYYLYLLIILTLPYLVMIPLKESDKIPFINSETISNITV